jgi:hypothetical protein
MRNLSTDDATSPPLPMAVAEPTKTLGRNRILPRVGGKPLTYQPERAPNYQVLPSFPGVDAFETAMKRAM